MDDKKRTKNLLIFFVIVAAVALGNGLSDSIYANYFKEVYHINAAQRAFIEFPRELPGMLCLFVTALLSGGGDIRIALIAQLCGCVGLVALGLLTPSFGWMLAFLFVSSMGMHLFMPLADSICISLAEPDQIGKRMGQSASFKTGFSFVAGLLVFFGFRSGIFSFQTRTKSVFLLGAGAFLVALLACAALEKRVGKIGSTRRGRKLLFRKEYKYYYLLTILNGVQKQIAFVFGSWVLIDLLGKGADVMALLIMAAGFLGIFFMNLVGRWMDRYGIRRMLFLDALSFIFVYLIYGFMVWGVTGGALPNAGWPVAAICALFVLDRLSMQLSIVKSMYLRSILVEQSDLTATLSTGLTLDHTVAIMAAQLSGAIWMRFGPQWVFFLAAFLSLGNLFVAWRAQPARQSGKPGAAEQA